MLHAPFFKVLKTWLQESTFTYVGSLIHGNEVYKYLKTARNLEYDGSKTRKIKLQADNRSIFMVLILIFF